MRTDTIKVDAHIVMLKERQLFHFLKNYNTRFFRQRAFHRLIV